MKTNTHTATSIGNVRAAILLGTLAVVVTAVACSRTSRVAGHSSEPVGASPRPAALQTVAPVVSSPAPVVVARKTLSAEKPSAAKSIAYRSRDYAVSFVYPWQYTFLNAKTVANGDPALRPNSDGHEGQFTLARIDIPKGFYPDTNYQSGYFILSLNQNLNQQECESVLVAGNDGPVGSDTISGVDFRWLETDSGGHGTAAKVRNYVTFTNGTCYELEMGVKTRNEDGLAREVNPDQVLRRLDAILKTVTILPATQNPAPAQVETSTAAAAPVSQN